MAQTKKKLLSENGPGQRLANAAFHLDGLAVTAQTLASQGKCCPHFANMLLSAAKENHGACAAVCVHQGYELPEPPKIGDVQANWLGK